MGNEDYCDGLDSDVYRSRGEVQIARLLEREGIAFQYEHPVAVVDRGRVRIWYPDFCLRDYGMIVEYFGMNDDPGYRQGTEHKVRVYRESGIDGVFLTEESFRGDWPGRILGEIEGILQARLDRFNGRPRSRGCMQDRLQAAGAIRR